MRLMHVSAHFPPNFVSGGTLVPQRLARELRGRGHDVSVYAGYLDPQRRELETWSDEDETGLPVRWIVTTPWTGWHDRNNFDNPAVTEDFQRHLRKVRPDVVHFHSLQSLGAGLVSAARQEGVRVVVTAHDFWWICARQFLVDRDHRPCCLVVDAGACPCEVDRAFLETRNRWLAERLADADLVLAPSRSAADILVANGVDPDRLEVDENGLPGPIAAAPSRERTAGSPVRFLYAGGPNAMKGWPVLADAARSLADLPGWTLDAYGLEGTPSPGHGEHVRLLPPYAPSELPAVLSRADVLVLPSVARESHSIMTREALLHGLVVVCTDTPGPEEAVTDGHNGLVVPAGDPTALATGMRSLVERPRLLEQLRAGTPDVSVRPLEDQVTGLEARYSRLVDRAPSPAAPTGTSPVRTVLFVCGITGAPLRYRARLAAEGLELLGVSSQVRHYRDPDLPALAAAADAVVFYRVPATVQVLALAQRVRARPEPVPVLFDVDDLIFDPDLTNDVLGLSHLSQEEVDLWWHGVRRYRTTMEQADGFVASTEALRQHATDVVGIPSWRFPNGAGLQLSRASDAAARRPRRAGPVRIGYFSGTSTHDHDWAHVEPAVLEVMRAHPDVELWLGGLIRPTERLDAVADRVHRFPMVEWRQLPELLRDVDVNLAPLAPGSRFNEAKSAIKWLEAALVGTPTVASPTQPFREAVDPGSTGLLADSVDEWRSALERLIGDPLLRGRLGSRARREVLLHLSAHEQGRRYLRILEEARAQVARDGHRQPGPGWVPVALDEPYTEAAALDPYEPLPGSQTRAAGTAARTAVRLRRAVTPRARRAAAIYRAEGPLAVTRAGLRFARRVAGRTARTVRRRAAARP